MLQPEALPIAGAFLVRTRLHDDARGRFARIYCENDLRDICGSRHIVQANHSLTRAVGAVRGLHFQHAPHAEMKMIRCLRGRVWDVVVDLRAGSPTLLRWHAVDLDAARQAMVVIPEGCAHGFQVMEPHSELLYLHTAAYRPEAEGGVRYDDPRVGIQWPAPVVDVSARDLGHLWLSDAFEGLAS